MTLTNVLEELCAEEYALPANAPRHRFSFKHRRAMNKILRPDNLPKAEKKLAFKRRIVIIAAVVLLAVVTGAASIIRHDGFWFRRASYEGQTYYEMFAENADKAPQTIEKLCYECNAPEKYERLDSMCHINENDAQEMYVDVNAVVPENHGKPAVRIVQMTKKSFFTTFQPETDYIKEVEVKGFKGFSYAHSFEHIEDDFIFNSVLWDCGDYIHIVVGTVSMEEIWSFVDGMTEI